jgi:hypothetical protein
VAVKNLNIARINIDHVEILIMDVINMISLNKFRVGGAAMLVDSNKNHHIEMVGQIASIPFVR